MNRRGKIKLVVTDADNTLYSWVDYIVPCMEAMVKTLVRTTGLEEDAIVASIREVFDEKETNEYAFVLQEAEVFAPLRKDFTWFQEHVIDPARFAFARKRKEFLKPYPSVHRTLHKLFHRGIYIVALSDAPAFPAEQRIRSLGLDRYIRALYGLRSYSVPGASKLDLGIIERIRRNYYRSAVRRVVELPLEYEKPNPEGLRSILREENVRPEEAVMVGDNRKKDCRIAQEVGVPDVWARYGTQIDPAVMEKLTYYSAPKVRKRNVAEPGEVLLKPTHTIDRFDELLEIIS